MNNKTSTLGIISLFIISGFINIATAQTYISGNLGFGILEDSDVTDDVEVPGLLLNIGYDTGFALSGAAGMRFTNFRGELEISYQKNDVNDLSLGGITVDAGVAGLSGDVSALSAMINGYYDFDTGTALTPYLTAGFGLSDIEFTFNFDDPDIGTVTEDDSDSVISFQFGAGVGYEFSENMVLDLRYRYFTADPEFGTTSSTVKNHTFMGGLRVNF